MAPAASCQPACFRKFFDLGSNSKEHAAPVNVNMLMRTKEYRHEKWSAMNAADSLPVSPPSTVPVTYNAITDAAVPPGDSSLIYAIITAMTPGVHNPAINLNRISWFKLPATADPSVAIDKAKRHGTITRFRPRASAISPTNGEKSATASVAADMTRLTRASDSLKYSRKITNRGCGEYNCRKTQKPEITTPMIKDFFEKEDSENIDYLIITNIYN